MELIKVKGPIIRWADIEAQEEYNRIELTRSDDDSPEEISRQEARIRELAPHCDRLDAQDVQVLTLLGLEFGPDGHVKTTPGGENILVVGAIDFSGSSHPEQKGIWSARRSMSGDYIIHEDEPYVTVMLRPGGPGGQDGESKSMRPIDVIRDIGMRLLGELRGALDWNWAEEI